MVAKLRVAFCSCCYRGTPPFGLGQFAGDFSGIGRGEQYRGGMSGRGTPPGDHGGYSYRGIHPFDFGQLADGF